MIPRTTHDEQSSGPGTARPSAPRGPTCGSEGNNARVMELRTYTLVSADALHHYTTGFWPRHIQSLRKHGITVHGVWVGAGTDVHRVFALVGYPPGGDPVRLAESYRDSCEFKEDHADFDISLIASTHTERLEPIPVLLHSVSTSAAGNPAL